MSSLLDFPLDGFQFDDDDVATLPSELFTPEELDAYCSLLDDPKADDAGASKGRSNQSTARNAERVETRRKKHRESMARLRADKRGRVAVLQTEEQRLHRRLQELLQRVAPHNETTHSLEYAELVQAAEALEKEKQLLESELHQHEKFTRFATAQTQRANSESTAWKRLDMDATTRSGCWIQFLDTEPSIFYAYESVASCATAVRASLRRFQLVEKTLAESPSTMTIQCLGWHIQQFIAMDGSSGRPVMRSRMSRRISRHNTSIQEIQNKTWELLNSTVVMSKMFSSAVVSKVVQRLSDDVTVVVRNSPARLHHKRFRHFNYNIRIPCEQDCAMILTAFLDKQQDPTSQQQQQDEEEPAVDVVWMTNGGSRTRFRHVGEDALELEYIGCIECLNLEHANHLMFQSVGSVLKWEQLVVPTQLLIL